MAEAAKDPAIKLFGKTIPLQEIPADNSCCDKPTVDDDDDDDDIVDGIVVDDGNDDDHDDDDDDSRAINHELPSSTNTDDMADDRVSQERAADKVDQDGRTSQTKQVGVSPEVSDKSNCQDTSFRMADNPEESSGGDEKAAGESSKSEEEKGESASQEKTPKKPDKILPCPRCNSMDTKFCYYNNYNVNQPRHFCKNCQRYWTAGGTMRNVPVGAGRRKNKNSASHYRHVTLPEPIHNIRPDMPNGVHPALPTNGAVLTFSSDAPLCESMASILNLAEKTARNGPPNGFQKPEELKISIPFVGVDSAGNHHVDGSNSKDDGSRSTLQEQPAAQNCLPYPPQIPCYPGGPWTYPWNSTQWSPPVAAPPFCPNGFAMPFYPAPAYWGCTVPGTWNIPWIAQPPPPPSHSNPSSAPNSPLGKHSREGNILSSTNSEEKELEENGSERSLWIPKTLRIDDPGEAAKSSIWTTLGIKNNDKSDSIGRGSGLFKAFQSKRDEGNPHMDTSSVLEANPAALSRSQTFHENS